MAVLAVRDAGLEAVEAVRAGEGPQILEMKTYRYRGHSMSDPAKYRTKDEVSKMKEERDPIDQMRALRVEHKVADEARFKELDKAVKARVAKSAEFAQTSPEPDPSELHTDVLVDA